MSYQVFAILFSLLAVVTVTLAAVISRRRARLAEYRDIEEHQARPLLTVMWLIAFATLASAIALDSSLWPLVVDAAMSVIRGLIIAVAILFLWRYWRVRETWL